MVLRDKITLGFIAVLLVLALMTLLWPAFGRAIDREEIKLGLDLEGGAHLVYEADFSQMSRAVEEDDLILAQYDAEAGEWVHLEGLTVWKKGDTVYGSLAHAGTVGLLVPVLPGTIPAAAEGPTPADETAQAFPSGDGKARVILPQETVVLDAEGNPLSAVAVVKSAEFPAAPDHAQVWAAYDVGPDGATFDPPAVFTMEYDEKSLPEGVDTAGMMDGIQDVIESRVNAYGVSEPDIQQVGSDRLLVQLPGIEDIEQAKALIGKTVLVDFREFKLIARTSSGSPVLPSVPGTLTFFAMGETDEGDIDLVEVPVARANWVAIPAVGTMDDGEERALTSQYFKGKVSVEWSGTNDPVISFSWNSEGSQISSDVTSRLRAPEGQVGSPENRLGIFVGDDYVSAPVVRGVISSDGVIEGMKIGEAKRLANLLNAGRIDAPLRTVEEHDVSATLGANFVDWSVQAGVIGLILIILFLIAYYRLPGGIAGLALLIYAAFVMAMFQLVEVVLTLAGIAGFILSIGMAVDANVLIFERMREEIRGGRTVRAAVEVGFNRAWPAIRDSNISTLLTCLILYVMGDWLGVPSVKGFAITLAIGVIISMLSAIIVTRTFLRTVGTTHYANSRSLFASARGPLTLSGEGR